MKSRHNQKRNTLLYWYFEEMLLPNEIPAPAKTPYPPGARNTPVGREGGPAPESYVNTVRSGCYGEVKKFIHEKLNENLLKNARDGKGEPVVEDDGYRWFIKFYGGIYGIGAIEKFLGETAGGRGEESDSGENKSVSSRTFAASYVVSITPEGRYAPGSFALSTAPWFIRKMTENDGVAREVTPADFRNDCLGALGSMEERAAAAASIDAVLLEAGKIAKATLGDHLLDPALPEEGAAPRPPKYCAVATLRKVSNNGEEEGDAPFLNSFYLEDISRILEDESYRKDPLVSSYLEMGEEPPGRVDLRTAPMEELYSMVSPDRIPPGAWPTPGGYPLVFSQQIALNNIMGKIAPHRGEGGIYSVNGPPGTGKTTMLREIIANIIVERARRIADFEKPDDAFGRGIEAWRSDAGPRYLRPIDSALTGFEIVIASSNNGAVENVTMEIPLTGSVSKEWREDLEYFPEVGRSLAGRDTWGAAAAKLGNSKNKSEFCRKFIWGDGDGGGRGDSDPGVPGFAKSLEIEVEKLAENGISPLENFREAKDRFTKSLRKVEEMKAKFKEKLAEAEKERTEAEDLRKRLFEEKKKVEGKLAVLAKLEKKRGDLADALSGNRKQIEERQKNLEDIREEEEFLSREHQTLRENLTEARRGLRKAQGPFSSLVSLFSEKRRKARVEIADEVRRTGKRIEEILERMREEREKKKRAQAALRQVESNRRRLLGDLESAEGNLSLLTEEIRSAETNIRRLEELLETADRKVERTKRKLKEDYSYMILDEEEREKSSPFTCVPEFQRARVEVFVSAVRLHKAFLLCNAKAVKSNLYALQDILQSPSLEISRKETLSTEEAVARVWAVAFMCIPVLSTTFASLSRLFSHIWDSKLGWLLIDEAGQGPAKVALGGLKRFSGAVVVGDPLQLEPIVGLPDPAQESLVEMAEAPNFVLSSTCSIQSMSDRGQKIGTYIEEDSGRDIWVGSPLRVHRRCSSPMFEISNRTTYRGLMISGKNPAKFDAPDSCWIDVCGEEHEGNWIAMEGQAVESLIDRLEESGIGPGELYVISPFRQVVDNLKRIFRSGNKRVQAGTVHTTQGKEAVAVILVLGGAPGKPGPKAWASCKPNLLNVAATRAKERLYIVGNYSEWSKQRYFAEAASLLKRKKFTPGNLRL